MVSVSLSQNICLSLVATNTMSFSIQVPSKTFVSSITKVRTKRLEREVPVQKYILPRLPTNPDKSKIKKITFVIPAHYTHKKEKSVAQFKKRYLKYLKQQNPNVQFQFDRLRVKVDKCAKCVIEYVDESVDSIDLHQELKNQLIIPRAFKVESADMVQTQKEGSSALVDAIIKHANKKHINEDYVNYLNYRRKEQI